jgi:hypothetical protein
LSSNALICASLCLVASFLFLLIGSPLHILEKNKSVALRIEMLVKVGYDFLGRIPFLGIF